MRILVVHNRYLQRGGEDHSMQARVRLLRECGHAVDTFVEDNARLADMGRVRAAVRTVWSKASYRRLRRMFSTGGYDVMDAHNTFPLISPSAYYAAHADGVAVVQTLHNYRLLCPGSTFFRSGRPCEDCLGRSVAWPAVRHACYRGSRGASAAIATMVAAHRVLGTWTDAVDAYIALTNFARQKFIAGGIPASRIVVAPNFVEPDPGPGDGDGEYALFVGRLAPEKGIRTLLRAWTSVGSRLTLKVVGDGPLRDEVVSAATTQAGVEWLGEQPSERVQQLMGSATVLVVPSEWYETFGLVIIEAYARATPVLASRIGALEEIVDDGETGLLFEPGDAHALASSALSFASRPSERARMGAAARRKFEQTYTAAKAAPAIFAAYDLALGTRSSR